MVNKHKGIIRDWMKTIKCKKKEHFIRRETKKILLILRKFYYISTLALENLATIK